jgi:hypothetical protein
MHEEDVGLLWKHVEWRTGECFGILQFGSFSDLVNAALDADS